MDLKEFVKTTLCDIMEGIHDATNQMVDKDYHFQLGYTSDHRGVEFDIALTVEEGSTSNTGGKIKIASGILGAQAGNAREGQSRKSEISRVKFIIEPRGTRSISEARRNSGK